jgi:hypothetical protein
MVGEDFDDHQKGRFYPPYIYANIYTLNHERSGFSLANNFTLYHKDRGYWP